jgi:hypothetical protein
MNEEEKIEKIAEELMEGWEETAKQVDKALSSIPEDTHPVLVFSELAERTARVAMFFGMDETEFGEFSKVAYRCAVRNMSKEEVH